MKKLSVLRLAMTLLVAGTACAQALGPFAASSNFAADLYGAADTRPGCWGYSDVATWNITFRPPAGYAVRILSIHGDLVAWIKSLQEIQQHPLRARRGCCSGYRARHAPPQRDGATGARTWSDRRIRRCRARRCSISRTRWRSFSQSRERSTTAW